MVRPKKTVPNYPDHVSDQAVVTFNGTNFYLGKHNSPESQAKYSRLVAEYIESGYLTPNAETHQGATAITVTDVARNTGSISRSDSPTHRRKSCGSTASVSSWR